MAKDNSVVSKNIKLEKDIFEALNGLANVTGLSLGEVIGCFMVASEQLSEEQMKSAFEDEIRNSLEKKLTNVGNAFKR